MIRTIFILILASFTIIFSQGRYHVEKTVIEKPEKNTPGLLEYSLYDAENELYKLEFSIEYDVPHPSPVVFEDGSLMLLSAFEKNAYIYTGSGTELKEVSLGGEENVYEAVIFYHASGDEALIVIPEHSENYNKNIIISSKGELLAEFSTPYEQINGIAYSAELKKSAYSKVSWQGIKPVKEILVRDTKGNIQERYNGAFFKAAFIGDNLWAADKKEYKLISLDGGTPVSEKLPESRIILDLKVYKDTAYLVTSSKPVLKNGLFVSADLEIISYHQDKQTGKMILNREIGYGGFSVNEKGKAIHTKTGEKIPVKLAVKN